MCLHLSDVCKLPAKSSYRCGREHHPYATRKIYELRNAESGETVCGERCHCRQRQQQQQQQQAEHQEELAALRERVQRQSHVIEYYRGSLVPRLRADVARLTSESHALAWRLQHAHKELSIKNSHMKLLETQRQQLRGQLDAGKVDVPAFVLGMRQTLAQLETNLAQSHEERCQLFSDVSMLRTEKALVVRELRDTERRIEALQQEAVDQRRSHERQLAQLAEQLARAQSRTALLTDQLRQQEAQARLERHSSAQQAATAQQENTGLREQIDNLFCILAKKDETAYKLCSKLLTLKESRDRKDTEVLETMSKYQIVVGKVLDQLNDVNMENLLLVSNRLEKNQPQQYKMLLESLKFKIFLETENSSMTQECHRLRYENAFLQQENERLAEQLQEVQLRLLPQELRDEHVVLRRGRLTRLRCAASTQTEPQRRESTAASTSGDKDSGIFHMEAYTSPTQSNVSIWSLPEAQQDLAPGDEPAAASNAQQRDGAPTASTSLADNALVAGAGAGASGPRSQRQRRRGSRGARPAGVTWGQLLETTECSRQQQLRAADVTHMMQLAVAQSCRLERLDSCIDLSSSD